MRYLSSLLMFVLVLPALCQTSDFEEYAGSVMGGYLYQTAITPESFLITNEQELKSFVSMVPPVTPYKNLPAPPNPDPFLKGFTVDFEQSVLVVVVGRDRIQGAPTFAGVRWLEDGSRQVDFLIPPKQEPYPYGWAVYTAVVLARTEANTAVMVTAVPAKKERKIQRAEFKRL